MTSTATLECPFFVGGMITDLRFFVGRDEEIRFVMGAIANAQPMNVNLVGEKRSGKSSLIQMICQSYESRVGTYGRRAEEFVVVYLSLKRADCRSPNDFYQTIAQKLLERSVVQVQPHLVAALSGPIDGAAFARGLEKWKHSGVLPVICLDDFEEVLALTTQFDDVFFDNLRSLCNNSELMLVIASRRGLRDYKTRGLTSEFFNVSQTRLVGRLGDGDAQDVVRLPSSARAALGVEQQALALRWAEAYPALLQLAGKCLWDAKQNGRSHQWAKEQFDLDAKAVPRPFSVVRSGLLFVSRVGALGQNIGNTVDDWGNLVKGVIIIAIGLGVALKVVPWQDGLKFLQTQKDEVLDNGKVKSE
jgi:uncharacterized protein